MPLPRFTRLPDDARAAILTVARSHFARDGRDGASLNRIVAEAGISKTSAYHYFDGKDDLFGAVILDATERTLSALGAWREVESPGELWEQFESGADRLFVQLREHPEDRAVLAEATRGMGAGTDAWVPRLVSNAFRIGVADPALDRNLTTVATIGVVEAVDAWALEQEAGPGAGIGRELTLLLARLWNADRRA